MQIELGEHAETGNAPVDAGDLVVADVESDQVGQFGEIQPKLLDPIGVEHKLH